jgi:predicted small secreted protein
MKKSILVTALIVVWTIVILMLAGCHTVGGIGADLEAMSAEYTQTQCQH